MIKKFYSQINKREIFQTQLIEHNKRRLNILALKDLKRHMKENSRSKKIEFTHTRASKDSLNLKLIKIISRSINQFFAKKFFAEFDILMFDSKTRRQDSNFWFNVNRDRLCKRTTIEKIVEFTNSFSTWIRF
jgi:hypothetical protein